MKLFRAFVIYDLDISSFYLQMSRDIDIDNEWQNLLKEIKLQMRLQSVLEDKLLQMITNLGSIRGKFDIFQNRVLILISNSQVQEIYQNELLLKIYSHLFEISYYQKINITELELYQKYELEKIIKKYEEQLNIPQQGTSSLSYINYLDLNKQKNLNKKQIICMTEENIQKNSKLKQFTQIDYELAFKGFIIYDLKKQYFFMLIRKGFKNDDIWIDERKRIEKLILSQQKQQPKNITISTQFAQYQIEYESQTMFYYILLSHNRIPYSPQYELLQRIRCFISKESNLQKQNKNEIESKYLYVVSDIIDAQERIYIKQKNCQVSQSIPIIYQQQNNKFNEIKYKQELSLQQL